MKSNCSTETTATNKITKHSTSFCFVDIGHDVMAIILDYIPRENTEEVAPYRLVCTDFAIALDLYARKFSTDFMEGKLELTHFQRLTLQFPSPTHFFQSVIDSIFVVISDFKTQIPNTIGRLFYLKTNSMMKYKKTVYQMPCKH